MDIGIKGEEIAEEYLRSLNYKILQRNFRYRKGEIDIISSFRGSIIFVEVKSRKNSKFGLPREAVNGFKQKQIYHTARYYLNKVKKFESNVRFDVIEVYFEDPIRIEHIQNAFDGNDVEVF